MALSKWLRGSVGATPAVDSYVRVTVDGKRGLYHAEVYVTRKEARELRDRLDQILSVKS